MIFIPMYIPSTHEFVWTYNQYLNSKHWNIVKYQLAQIFPRICFQCGNTHNLNIHHMTYERLGAEYPMDLVYLCESCHKALHAYVRHQKLVNKRRYKQQW